jgi:hypothetical protein
MEHAHSTIKEKTLTIASRGDGEVGKYPNACTESSGNESVKRGRHIVLSETRM